MKCAISIIYGCLKGILFKQLTLIVAFLYYAYFTGEECCSEGTDFDLLFSYMNIVGWGYTYKGECDCETPYQTMAHFLWAHLRRRRRKSQIDYVILIFSSVVFYSDWNSIPLHSHSSMSNTNAERADVRHAAGSTPPPRTDPGWPQAPPLQAKGLGLTHRRCAVATWYQVSWSFVMVDWIKAEVVSPN